jgi:hypothetical protein
MPPVQPPAENTSPSDTSAARRARKIRHMLTRLIQFRSPSVVSAAAAKIR